MKTPRVQEVCLRIWDLRGETYYARRSSPLAERDLARELGMAVGEDLRDFPKYDWTQDRRVEWAMELLRAAGQGREPKASAELEAVGGMLLGRDGELVVGGRGTIDEIREKR